MKKTLKERLQQLAGLKPLYEQEDRIDMDRGKIDPTSPIRKPASPLNNKPSMDYRGPEGDELAMDPIREPADPQMCCPETWDVTFFIFGPTTTTLDITQTGIHSGEAGFDCNVTGPSNFVNSPIFSAGLPNMTYSSTNPSSISSTDLVPC